MSIAAFAAVLSWTLIFLLRPALKRLALAHPVARSSHKVPTPQGAGVAIAAATTLVCGAYGFWFGTLDVSLHVFCLALALATMVAVGLLDDIYGLSIRIRLGAQCGAALLIVASMPAQVSVFGLSQALWIERIIEAGALLTFMNLVNFIDGLDEISIAHSVPALAGVATIACWGRLPDWVLPLAAAACGGMIGFWPWNRHPARMFLGDSGSLPLGLLLGYLMIILAGSGYWSAAMLLSLYPLCDGAWTLFDRIRRNQDVTQGHRDHCYQRATTRGLSVPTVSRTVLLLSAILALLAQAIRPSGPIAPHAALAAIGLLITAATLRWLAFGWRPSG